MFSPGNVQVFPRQIGCFPSIKALFSEGKGIVFPAYGLRSGRFHGSEAWKGGFPPRFSSRIFVRISLSRWDIADKAPRASSVAAGLSFGPNGAILRRLACQSVTD